MAEVYHESIANGPGIRYVVFVQGCPHNCEGCHNPSTHDFGGGKNCSVEDITAEITKNPLLRGVTFSGGEPFEQAAALCVLAKNVRAKGLDIFCYSGYTFEEILASGDENKLMLLRLSDVLVDGQFVLAQRSLSLPLRGSKNQRVIDVAKSLAAGTVVLWNVE